MSKSPFDKYYYNLKNNFNSFLPGGILLEKIYIYSDKYYSVDDLTFNDENEKFKEFIDSKKESINLLKMKLEDVNGKVKSDYLCMSDCIKEISMKDKSASDYLTFKIFIEKKVKLLLCGMINSINEVEEIKYDIDCLDVESRKFYEQRGGSLKKYLQALTESYLNSYKNNYPTISRSGVSKIFLSEIDSEKDKIERLSKRIKTELMIVKSLREYIHLKRRRLDVNIDEFDKTINFLKKFIKIDIVKEKNIEGRMEHKLDGCVLIKDFKIFNHFGIETISLPIVGVSAIYLFSIIYLVTYFYSDLSFLFYSLGFISFSDLYDIALTSISFYLSVLLSIFIYFNYIERYYRLMFKERDENRFIKLTRHHRFEITKLMSFLVMPIVILPIISAIIDINYDEGKYIVQKGFENHYPVKILFSNYTLVKLVDNEEWYKETYSWIPNRNISCFYGGRNSDDSMDVCTSDSEPKVISVAVQLHSQENFMEKYSRCLIESVDSSEYFEVHFCNNSDYAINGYKVNNERVEKFNNNCDLDSNSNMEQYKGKYSDNYNDLKRKLSHYVLSRVNENKKIVISGHASQVGDSLNNFKLSSTRIKYVIDNLIINNGNVDVENDIKARIPFSELHPIARKIDDQRSVIIMLCQF
ncbi:hypothetical protein KDD30_19140 (plasmid) [Photobacterium sp. GJ3]|uniref:hypothetical protein n=1 Tax=Photobacterium sp. GJ3 TaxID=2829502 RepID=UPI001B8D9C9F|nr:hypothetical protein [Photobacterium sp. GJ3]QUJ70240.1 hypothetical protein KDD30_19140 [Photobacterium sp. GJ3]